MVVHGLTRVELIDHTSGGDGRIFGRWFHRPLTVQVVTQDGQRTVKIFLSDYGVPSESDRPDHHPNRT